MVVTVMVTIPEKDAPDLAKMLLQERVCACVNIIKGAHSIFWWEGKIEEAEETILLIKTKESLFAKLKTLIMHNHPYEIPEIIAFKINNINQEYLDWLNREANAVPFST
jgi:periplasmic divalent cation tolerance protein